MNKKSREGKRDEKYGGIITDMRKICMNCYHGKVCSADNRIAARINDFCNSFVNKTEVLKLPYTIGQTVIKYEDNEIVITSKR